jgi:hypothetical protein
MGKGPVLLKEAGGDALFCPIRFGHFPKIVTKPPPLAGGFGGVGSK